MDKAGLHSSQGNSQGSERDFLNPEKIVSFFEIEKGDYIADFGAGHGYFVTVMARIVGEEGKIYAIDIQKEVLESIRSRAKMDHLLNIEYIWADLELPQGSKLRSDFIDFVLISNLLFQVEKKDAPIKEAYRVLCQGGKLAVIDWSNQPSKLGPPQSMKVDKQRIKDISLKVGFEFVKEFPAGSHHFGLLFKK